MPEEINRLATDVLSTYLFTPSRDADENLRREGIPDDRIHFVGNVMIDTLERCIKQAERSPVFEDLGVAPGSYALLTLHRPSNVDEPGVLSGILDALETIQRQLPILFPVHPRTAKQILERGLGDRIDALPGLRLVDPLGYLDFLALQSRAKLVLTDSGGIQEETTVLGIPCVTLRENTERPITVTEGTNRIAGSDPARIVEAATEALAEDRSRARVPEFWDGRAAERIANVLRTASL